ncbi:hypothetical protein CTE05_36070 [Cellulomonas terrae]|uniref:Uncharacterized protein n=1 Tax=Cellulomonas terrae TaxID=311234 RepID=A0A511JPV0_9CELL|nr:hypothetical protein CTE05_36070 [Cellulomonas terrae]
MPAPATNLTTGGDELDARGQLATAPLPTEEGLLAWAPGASAQFKRHHQARVEIGGEIQYRLLGPERSVDLVNARAPGPDTTRWAASGLRAYPQVRASDQRFTTAFNWFDSRHLHQRSAFDLN